MIQSIGAYLSCLSLFSLVYVEHIRITEEDIEKYMMTNLAGSPPLDILVRSSGVKRLSDFLMWQVWSSTTYADRLVFLMGCFSAGVGKRATSFHSYLLAGYWVLGPFPCYSGLSGQGVESATAAGGLSDRGADGGGTFRRQPHADRVHSSSSVHWLHLGCRGINVLSDRREQRDSSRSQAGDRSITELRPIRCP